MGNSLVCKSPCVAEPEPTDAADDFAIASAVGIDRIETDGAITVQIASADFDGVSDHSHGEEDDSEKERQTSGLPNEKTASNAKGSEIDAKRESDFNVISDAARSRLESDASSIKSAQEAGEEAGTVAKVEEPYRIVILGGGVAAGYACKRLVELGASNYEICVIGDEPVVPYERPALTKAYLHPPEAKVRARLPGFHTCVGTGGERQLPEWYEENKIRIVFGLATKIDRTAQIVEVAELSIAYKKLIVATGCRPKRFLVPGKGLEGVYYINKETEAKAVVDALEARNGKGKVAIFGAGFIAVETAAALVGWGMEVTVFVPGQFVLPRLLNKTLAQIMQAKLKERGVNLIFNCDVTEICGENGAVSGVRYKKDASKGSKSADGSKKTKSSKSDGDIMHKCDMVIGALGSSPNTELLEGLTKSVKKEIIVNGTLQSSDPNVYAMGDIITSKNFLGQHRRLPHVDHARTSAKQAAEAAFGANPPPLQYTPFFYCRLFEYTDAPFAFNFFGEKIGEPVLETANGTQTRALWTHEGKVVAAMIMSSPPPSDDDRAKLKKIAEWRPRSQAVDKIFKSVGFE